MVADALLARAPHLIPSRACRVRRRRRWRLGVHDEDTELRRRIVIRAHPRCELALAHRAVQSRRTAGAEHHRQKIEGGRVDVQRARRPPAKRELCLADVAAHVTIPKATSTFLGRARRSHRRAAVKCAIQPLDFLHRVVCIDGAHDRENRVPRVIEVPIKTQQGIARQRAQSGLTANAPASNAMLVVQQFVQSLRRHRRRIVSLAFRFLNDHLELTRELR